MRLHIHQPIQGPSFRAPEAHTQGVPPLEHSLICEEEGGHWPIQIYGWFDHVDEESG